MSITEEIRKNEERKKLLEKELDEIQDKLTDIGYNYASFFGDRYSWREGEQFKLYDKLPTIEEFKTYMKYCGSKNSYGQYEVNHPLQTPKNKFYTHFNLEELAVILRVMCELYTEKAYKIITTGNMKKPGWSCNVYPELYYIVGEKSKVKKYEEHDGVFYEKLDKFNFSTPQKGIIVIPHIATERVFSKKDDKIWYPEYFSRTMKYFEYGYVCKNATAYFPKQHSIFKENLDSHLDEIKSHRDLFIFGIDQRDEIVSQLLYSIMIYKRKNDIDVLTDEDYASIVSSYIDGAHIEPISSIVKWEIPRELKYVEDQSVRKKTRKSQTSNHQVYIK